jgi:hypothetical protein
MYKVVRQAQLSRFLFQRSALLPVQKMNFAMAKYTWEDEDFLRNKTQHSALTHKSNAEELIS